MAENHPPAEAAVPLFGKEGSLNGPDPPRQCGPRRVSVYDFRRAFNAYGREIFIQEVEQHTGRPKIWYEFDRKGTKVRSARAATGITTTRLGPTEYL